jgi:hypothetical protein
MRKPTWKDRIQGAKDWMGEVVDSVIEMNFPRAKFSIHMMWRTLRGKFQVMEEDDYE